MSPNFDLPADLAAERQAAAAAYPALWDAVTAEWRGEAGGDRLWLLHAANYLLRTAGLRWAIDPLSLHQRLPEAPVVDAAALAGLEVVVLTHRHNDHFDPTLLRQLSGMPIRWILPPYLLELVQPLGIPLERITLARPGEAIRLGALTLTPFNGLHWAQDPASPDGRRGVPAMGLLAEFAGKRWLFPGDTRRYEAAALPAFGALDGLCAHIWLGKGHAADAAPALLPDFCGFCLELKPRRILLTHLNELGRPPEELWTLRHAALAAEWFAEHAPSVQVEHCLPGGSISL